MNRKTTMGIAALAASALLGAAALPAVAGPGGGARGDAERGGWHQNDRGGDCGFMRGDRGPGKTERGKMGRGGKHHMGGMMDSALYKSFDTDADGTVSAAELETGLQALLTRFDADGNGSLSETEFQALFAEATKERSARPFSMLDADDDKQISAEEMRFPAQMMARMQKWRSDAQPTPPAPATPETPAPTAPAQ